MAIVFRKTYPIPISAGAEIVTRRGEKVARWESGKRQVRYAEVLDDGRVMFVSDCWYIRYRNTDGVMTRETTGCREKQAAEKYLADVLARVDKVKAGVMSVEELAVGDRVVEPIGRPPRTTDAVGHPGSPRPAGVVEARRQRSSATRARG
jgi:hypothetical protein